VLPGPLTLRMMERVVSSMNSTRTWVTPPRDPIQTQISCYSAGSNPHHCPLPDSFPLSHFPISIPDHISPVAKEGVAYRYGRGHG